MCYFRFDKLIKNHIININYVVPKLVVIRSSNKSYCAITKILIVCQLGCRIQIPQERQYSYGATDINVEYLWYMKILVQNSQGA